MPTRTVTIAGAASAHLAGLPIARLAAVPANRMLGGIIVLDATRSSSTFDEIAYTWSITSAPIGSKVAGVLPRPDGARVLLTADKPGTYDISLSVSDGLGISEEVTASINVSVTAAPSSLRTTPDGNLFFNLISGFWQYVNNRDLLATIWSGYSQVAASLLLQELVAGLEKSIATIPDSRPIRWHGFRNAYSLPKSFNVIYGNHQYGAQAFTVSENKSLLAAVTGRDQVYLLDGIPSNQAIGTELTVLSGPFIGSYTIKAVTEVGYTVSPLFTSFSPAFSGISLETVSGSSLVMESDAGVDFVAAGVAPGDLLLIKTGPDAGWHNITAVGIPSGLLSNRYLRVANSLVSLGIRAYEIFTAESITSLRRPSTYTDTIFIPKSEASLRDLEQKLSLSGTLTLQSASRVKFSVAGPPPVSIGASIELEIRGRAQSFTVISVGPDFVVTLSRPVIGEYSGATLRYRVAPVSWLPNRLVTVGEDTRSILSVKELPKAVNPSTGIAEAVWALKLDAPLVSGRSGLSWNIAATIFFDTVEDFANLGISEGDALVVHAEDLNSGLTADLVCRVVGAHLNGISFYLGGTPDPTYQGGLNSEELDSFFGKLNVPSVVDGVPVSVAASITDLVADLGFRRKYFNVLTSSETNILDLDYLRLRLTFPRVIRNSRITVPSEVASVPSLFSHIVDSEVGIIDGQLVVLREGIPTPIESVPLDLLENTDYVLCRAEAAVGWDLETTAGSGLVVSDFGDFINLDVRVGDILFIESGISRGEYVVQRVASAEELFILHRQTGLPPAATETSLRYRILRGASSSYIKLVPGVYEALTPAPLEFWGQTIFVDNTQAIEDNFGIAVGVLREDLASTYSYRNVVHTLMRSMVSGHSTYDMETAFSAIAGLPILTNAGIIAEIEPEYLPGSSLSRILVELLEDGAGTGVFEAFYFTPAVEDQEEFTGIAVNIDTGEEFRVGDVVSPFTVLAKGVWVDDYLTRPDWWRQFGDLGRSEITKFHNWRILANLAVVRDDSLPVIESFAHRAKPAHTHFELVGVLILTTTITVEDEVFTDSTDYLSDDFALSIEATHMLDDSNYSSLARRILDKGTLATKTLFEGRDLTSTAGSGTVVSARGGFVGNTVGAALPHDDFSNPTGSLPGINEWFPNSVVFWGSPLVRSGDILLIRSGPNEGRYIIGTVVDDNTLQVTELVDWPPSSKPAALFEEAEDQIFQVQRLDESLLAWGTGELVSYDAGSDFSVLEDSLGSFMWSGVTTGDVVVISSGPNLGSYVVIELGERSGLIVTDHKTKLTVKGELVAGSFTYAVRRRALARNPIFQGSGDTVLGGRAVTVGAGGLVAADVLAGDLVVPTTGSSAGEEFLVLDVDDNVLWVQESFATTETITFEVRRKFAEIYENRDSDFQLEEVSPSDSVSLSVLEPSGAVTTVVDFSFTAGTSTASSAVDLLAAGITAGMKLEIDPAHAAVGVYEINSVATNSLTITKLWPATEAAVTGTIYGLSADFAALDDSVTLSGTNLEVGDVTGITAPEAGVTFTSGSTAVTSGAGTFLTTLDIGSWVRLAGDGPLAWARVVAVIDDNNLTVDRNYVGTGGVGNLEVGAPAPIVRPGDQLELDGLGIFVVWEVTADSMLVTRDTGVNPSSNYTGRVIRTTGDMK